MPLIYFNLYEGGRKDVTYDIPQGAIMTHPVLKSEEQVKEIRECTTERVLEIIEENI